MTFNTLEDAQEALKSKQGVEFDGQELYLDTCGKNTKKDAGGRKSGGFDGQCYLVLLKKNSKVSYCSCSSESSLTPTIEILSFHYKVLKISYKNQYV